MFVQSEASRIVSKSALLLFVGVLALAAGVALGTPDVRAQVVNDLCSITFEGPFDLCSEEPLEWIDPSESLQCPDDTGYKVNIQGERCGASFEYATVKVTCNDLTVIHETLPPGSTIDYDVNNGDRICASGIRSILVKPYGGTELKNVKATVDCCDDEPTPEPPTPPPPPGLCDIQQGSPVNKCWRVHEVAGGWDLPVCDDTAGYNVTATGIACFSGGPQYVYLRVKCLDDTWAPPVSMELRPGDLFTNLVAPAVCASTGGVKSVRLDGAKTDDVAFKVECVVCAPSPP